MNDIIISSGDFMLEEDEERLYQIILNREPFEEE